jgi:hypothetical protein
MTTRFAVICLFGLIGLIRAPLAAQTNLTATPTAPTKVALSWTGAPGANGYSILRGIGTTPLEKINPGKVSGTTYTDLTAPAGTALRYRIRASYPNSPSTYSLRVSVTTPTAATGVASSPVASPVPAAEIPSSPTTPQPGAPTTARLAPSSQAVLQQLPQGTPLRVAEAAPVPLTTTALAPAAVAPAPAPTPIPATPVSGRYRVVANGFSVIHESYDDMLSRDGKYDEVYGGFTMLHFDRKTGDVLDRDLRRTKVLGDIQNFPDRLRAGTASGTGGLRAGDSYPDAGHARFRGQDGAAPNRQTFPFEVWEGTLTDGADAAIILPTMWEADNEGSTYDAWHQSEVSSASQIWFDGTVQQALKQTSLGVIAPPGAMTPNTTPVFSNESFAAGFFAAMGQPWVASLIAGSRDRPIGMVPMGPGVVGPAVAGPTIPPSLPRRAIVLTREIVEHALNGSRILPDPASLGPGFAWMLAYFDVPVGVIPVLLRDGPGQYLQANYVLYLQVERM